MSRRLDYYLSSLSVVSLRSCRPSSAFQLRFLSSLQSRSINLRFCSDFSSRSALRKPPQQSLLSPVILAQNTAYNRNSSPVATFATMAATAIPGNVDPRVELLSSNIEKPELDDRSYRFIKLRDNKLEALLVHDPKTEKSSAAMDVHVGHLSDPKDFQGLAHALEHCLFLGIPYWDSKSLTFRHQKVPGRE